MRFWKLKKERKERERFLGEKGFLGVSIIKSFQFGSFFFILLLFYLLLRKLRGRNGFFEVLGINTDA